MFFSPIDPHRSGFDALVHVAAVASDPGSSLFGHVEGRFSTKSTGGSLRLQRAVSWLRGGPGRLIYPTGWGLRFGVFLKEYNSVRDPTAARGCEGWLGVQLCHVACVHANDTETRHN